MPIHRTSDNKWQWGSSGAKYSSRKGAERQAAAAYSNGYQGKANVGNGYRTRPHADDEHGSKWHTVHLPAGKEIGMVARTTHPEYLEQNPTHRFIGANAPPKHASAQSIPGLEGKWKMNAKGTQSHHQRASNAARAVAYRHKTMSPQEVDKAKPTYEIDNPEELLATLDKAAAGADAVAKAGVGGGFKSKTYPNKHLDSIGGSPHVVYHPHGGAAGTISPTHISDDESTRSEFHDAPKRGPDTPPFTAHTFMPGSKQSYHHTRAGAAQTIVGRHSSGDPTFHGNESRMGMNAQRKRLASDIHESLDAVIDNAQAVETNLIFEPIISMLNNAAQNADYLARGIDKSAIPAYQSFIASQFAEPQPYTPALHKAFYDQVTNAALHPTILTKGVHCTLIDLADDSVGDKHSFAQWCEEEAREPEHKTDKALPRRPAISHRVPEEMNEAFPQPTKPMPKSPGEFRQHLKQHHGLGEGQGYRSEHAHPEGSSAGEMHAKGTVPKMGKDAEGNPVIRNRWGNNKPNLTGRSPSGVHQTHHLRNPDIGHTHAEYGQANISRALPRRPVISHRVTGEVAMSKSHQDPFTLLEAELKKLSPNFTGSPDTTPAPHSTTPHPPSYAAKAWPEGGKPVALHGPNAERAHPKGEFDFITERQDARARQQGGLTRTPMPQSSGHVAAHLQGHHDRSAQWIKGHTPEQMHSSHAKEHTARRNNVVGRTDRPTQPVWEHTHTAPRPKPSVNKAITEALNLSLNLAGVKSPRPFDSDEMIAHLDTHHGYSSAPQHLKPTGLNRVITHEGEHRSPESRLSTYTPHEHLSVGASRAAMSRRNNPKIGKAGVGWGYRTKPYEPMGENRVHSITTKRGKKVGAISTYHGRNNSADEPAWVAHHFTAPGKERQTQSPLTDNPQHNSLHQTRTGAARTIAGRHASGNYDFHAEESPMGVRAKNKRTLSNAVNIVGTNSVERRPAQIDDADPFTTLNQAISALQKAEAEVVFHHGEGTKSRGARSTKAARERAAGSDTSRSRTKTDRPSSNPQIAAPDSSPSAGQSTGGWTHLPHGSKAPKGAVVRVGSRGGYYYRKPATAQAQLEAPKDEKEPEAKPSPSKKKFRPRHRESIPSAAKQAFLEGGREYATGRR